MGMTLLQGNAAILRDMAESGSNLAPARPVDFSHIFADRPSAERFVKTAQRYGFRTELSETEQDEYPWDATATKEMVPSAEEITSVEEMLDALARNEGGRADGWGFFRV
jgi:multidrug resistance efflux pump